MLFGKYINKYYRKYWYFFLIGFIALVVVDYVQLFIPEYLGEIVDRIRAGNIDQVYISSLIWKVLGVALTLCIGRVLWRLTLLNASKRIEAGLRSEMFEKAERLSQRYYHENKVGTIMAWFTNDIETIEEFFGWGSIMFVDAIFLSLFVIIKMISLDWILSLMAFIPAIILIVWGALVEKFMSSMWENRQKAFDDLYDFSQENFTGIRVIKAFVKENQEIKAFAKIAKKNQNVNIKFVRVSVIFDVLISTLCTIIFCLIMGFGGFFTYMFVKGSPVVLFNHSIELTSGNLVTFISYFDSLIWPMIALGQIVAMHARSKASLKRITHFLDEEEEICNPKNAIVLDDVKGNIKFNDFTFVYPDDNSPSLKNISFEIKAGEKIGVVGKIGSGKTTLVNSLLRIYNVRKGSIFIDGHDLMECDIDSIRNVIGYVPQDNFLFSDTISSNIAFSNEKMTIEQIQDAAKFADVHSNIVDFKEGYKTISGERGVTLSGGQKQRISIARAYIKNSPIMILDDSVSAVDVKTEETILHNIVQYRANKTTILIASRVSTVAKMDKVLVLNDGNLEAFDTPENLLKISPTYQKMVYLQALEAEVEGGKR